MHSKLSVNFKNTSNNSNPEYTKEGDSGFDLRAYLAGPVKLLPMMRAVIPTGLFFEIPKHFEIQIRSRSGLAAKNGVIVLNSPGTVDQNYIGEIKVILINLGEEPFVINNGDRIAQAIIAGVFSKTEINLSNVNNINENTSRGSDGFGSSGLK